MLIRTGKNEYLCQILKLWAFFPSNHKLLIELYVPYIDVFHIFVPDGFVWNESVMGIIIIRIINELVNAAAAAAECLYRPRR